MVAEAVLSSTLQLLANFLVQKVNYLGVEEKVDLLKDELKRMLCYLKDANRKQAEDEKVRIWISDIRDVAHDAKDAIEMFVLKIERKGMLGRISSFTKHAHYVTKIGKEIDCIQKRLNDINRSRQMYGIKDLGEASESQVELRRRPPPWQNDEYLVGMKDEVKKLLEKWITNKEKGLSIAVVEGMGGIGKSTLARKLYSHDDVVYGGLFECCGWVVVSSEFTPKETIKQLIFQLSRSEEEKNKLLEKLRNLGESMKDTVYLRQMLEEMLHKLLDGKSYFIVLDDVWEMKHLEALISAFPNQQDKTSRLLITTRNKVITKYGHYALKMEVLDPEKSWELFLKKAFVPNALNQCPKELEEIGRKIVQKCNGLPLAITVVGGLLVETQTKKGWQDVLDQVNHQYFGKAESSISTILELSYQNLSPQLKSCFLCLASFKEDATIPTKRLIHIWMGQGLIQPEERRTVEDVARGYLDELINRNMVQIKDLTVDNRVKNCHLHDLFHDVCLVKAKEEIGFEIVREEKGVASEETTPLYKPRHRVVYGANLDTLDHNRHLRSLFLHNVCIDGSKECYLSTSFRFWKRFKILETLYLEGVGLRRFPHSFRSLIGLRYLRIHCGSSDKTLKIPSWFDHLKRIEVVDMRSQDVELPHSTLIMDKLRYFRAARIHGAINLESWKSIETLEYIGLNNLMKWSSKVLSTCPIRELGLYFDGEREGDELRRARKNLEMMGNLVKLKLMCLTLSIQPEIIPHLPNLTRLKLRGGMRRCPSWSMFPPNLSHLTLVETFMDEDPMAELGKLPSLLYLKLTGYACLDERMKVLKNGFPGLRGLSLKGMYFLRGIDVEEGGMPHLKLLTIRGCPALETKNLPEHITVSLSAA